MPPGKPPNPAPRPPRFPGAAPKGLEPNPAPAAGAGAGAACLCAGFSAGNFANSAAKRCRAPDCRVAVTSSMNHTSSASCVDGTHPAASKASVPPSQPATFFTNTAFSILMRRNLASPGFFSTFSVIFSRVCRQVRRTSKGFLKISWIASSSSGLTATGAEGGAAADGAANARGTPPPMSPKGFSPEDAPPPPPRICRSKFSMIARSAWPLGVDSASSAMCTISGGRPLPFKRNFATSSA
mmetsp:Transcript_78310/g.227155  ORF Transcript_78310/g.227155 Transcript_78310/m.227155 type:complete len:240 (+) Transcript_78310:318-1037(+)